MASAPTSQYTNRSTYGTTTTISAARPWCARRRPLRPPPVRRSVAQWEKDFCESHGVPWKKVTDAHAGVNAEGPDGRVAQWDDSGAVQALLAAKRRYWAEINGGLAAPPPPDPDLYNDAIAEEDGVLDPELVAEYEAALRAMEVAWEENAEREVQVVSKLPDDFVPVPTGWDDDVAPVDPRGITHVMY